MSRGLYITIFHHYFSSPSLITIFFLGALGVSAEKR